MTKYLTVGICFIMAGCGGSLSDEQREKIKEGLEYQKVVKISDAEIMEEAIQKGQQIFSSVEKTGFNSRQLDSISRSNKVAIRFLAPGKVNARAIEQELIDAYINGIATGDTQENLQKIWINEKKDNYDSLLYTRPQLVVHPDGVEELKGVWNIYIAKKDVVLNITKRK